MNALNPDTHPIAMFNRNLTGANPDFERGGQYQPADLALSEDTRQWIILHDPRSEMTYSALTYNWDRANGRPVLVIFLQFSVNTEKPTTTPYMIDQIVRQLGRNTPVLVINNPGMLGSSKLTPDMRLATSGGDFGPLGWSLRRAIRTVTKKSPLILTGYSLGARLALAVAKASLTTRSCQQLILVEPPGLTRYKLLDFSRRFAQIENGWLAFYQDTTQDAELKKCLGKRKGMIAGGLDFIRALQGDYHGNWALIRGMQVDTGVDELMMVSRHVPCTLIQGTSSHISHPYSLPGMRRVLLPGDSHSFGEEGRRIAWHIVDAIRS